MKNLKRFLPAFTIALIIPLTCAQAQSLAGTYGREIPTGLLAVSFEERHGMLVGQIVMGGLSYPTAAQLDDRGAFGRVYMGRGVAYYELRPCRAA